jgi:hypothetical protein
VVRWLQAQGWDPDLHALIMDLDNTIADNCWDASSEEESGEREVGDRRYSSDGVSSNEENLGESSSEEEGQIVRVPRKCHRCTTRTSDLPD